MSYKTFEDMKHDIPEGATHYQNETANEFFSFFKRVDGVNYHYCPDFMFEWVELGDQGEMLEGCVKPIPQTETPEEKEAFDSMANNSELPNSSEWDGKGLPPVGAVYTVDPNYDGELLCKYSSEYVVVGEMLPRETYKGMEVIIDVVRQRNRVFKKPETPQQREERERLGLVKKACLTVSHDYGLMSDADRNFLEKQGMEWLKAFDKAK